MTSGSRPDAPREAHLTFTFLLRAIGRVRRHVALQLFVMPLMLPLARILAIGLVLPVIAGLMSGCGQKGPLYVPATPAAAERATLPQTVFGQPAARPVSPASAPPPASVPAALPNLPETQ